MIEYKYPASKLGTNGVLLTASGATSAFPVNDASTVRIDYSVTWAAATTLTFKVQTRRRGGEWKYLFIGEPSSGVVTYYEFQHSKATGGADLEGAEQVTEFDGADEMRITDITGAGATTDTVVLSVVVLQEKDK